MITFSRLLSHYLMKVIILVGEIKLHVWCHEILAGINFMSKLKSTTPSLRLRKREVFLVTSFNITKS